MGIKIAGELAYHGHRVKMYDANTDSLNSAYERIEEDKHHLQHDGLLPQLNFIGQVLFISSLDEAVRDAEFVFEVVPEDLSIKQELFKKISECCTPSAVIATNTLRLDVSAVTELVTHKERAMGVRFLYPVYCIPEVEITPSKCTSPDAIDRVRSLMERMGKTLFFRSGGEPLILSEEQREFRKNARLEQIKNSSGHSRYLENSLPTFSHRGNVVSLHDDESFSLSETGKDCAICMDRQRDCLLCPCHHLVTCNDCAKSLISRRDGCPICRKDITQIIHVYHS